MSGDGLLARGWGHRARLWLVARGAVVVIVAVLALLAVSAAPAGAAGASPSCSAGMCTVTFGETGAPVQWTAPAGVNSAVFTVDGAAGGAAPGGDPGLGAEVSATLLLAPGATFTVTVGGAGEGGLIGGGGGFNGGGAGGLRDGGGGGGGFSSVADASGSLLLLAGGGGGAGVGGQSASGPTPAGGAGGAGSEGGANGDKGGNVTDSGGALLTGGDGGSSGAKGGRGGIGAGGGGSPSCQPSVGSPGGSASGHNGGSANFRDSGGTSGGGGGGGGATGGGAGASGARESCPGGGGVWASGGGGGGGGSSFGPPGARFSSGVNRGDGKVTISYTVAQAQVAPSGLSFAAQPKGTVSPPQTLTITNTGLGSLVLTGLTFAGADPHDFVFTSITCLGPIAPGPGCQIGVAFAPGAEGSRSASLEIASNDPNGPVSVRLSGTGGELRLPAVAALHVSPDDFAVDGRRVEGRCVAATRADRGDPGCKRAIKLRIAYQLNAPASVRITIARQLPGRLSRKRCLKPTRRNRQHRRCIRLIAVRGALIAHGRHGANDLNFDGRIDGHKLTAGHYRLTATPTGDGRTGSARTVTFTIAT